MTKRITIELTLHELQLLNHGLGNGIMDEAIENIGLSTRDQHTLARVGNRLLTLANSGAPRYHEE